MSPTAFRQAFARVRVHSLGADRLLRIGLYIRGKLYGIWVELSLHFRSTTLPAEFAGQFAEPASKGL
jgi:hypothetical protein